MCPANPPKWMEISDENENEEKIAENWAKKHEKVTFHPRSFDTELSLQYLTQARLV